MNNSIYRFDQNFSKYTGQGYLPYTHNGKIKSGYFGDDIEYLFINNDVINLLNFTKIPKKTRILKLPFDHIYLSNFLKFDDLILPDGISLIYNDFDEEIKEYIIVFNYFYENHNGTIFFKLDKISFNTSDVFEIYNYDKNTNYMTTKQYNDYDFNLFEDSGIIQNININIKKFKIKKIQEFIYKLLLFLECPDVELKKTENKPKMYKNQEYNIFQPKKNYTELSHDLRRYIYEFKRKTGIKINYHYKFIVRGHFRTYKKKIIWIKPFYKGHGLTIKKDKIVCRNI